MAGRFVPGDYGSEVTCIHNTMSVISPSQCCPSIPYYLSTRCMCIFLLQESKESAPAPSDEQQAAAQPSDTTKAPGHVDRPKGQQPHQQGHKPSGIIVVDEKPQAPGSGFFGTGLLLGLAALCMAVGMGHFVWRNYDNIRLWADQWTMRSNAQDGHEMAGLISGNSKV